MNIWKVLFENEDWSGPSIQSVYVLTDTPEVESAISVAKSNVTSGHIISVEYVSSAYK